MTKIGIVGYGNLGKACEKIVMSRDDMSLVGIFTRRDPATMISPYGSAFFRQDDLDRFENEIDVLALCTGSANDLVDLALKQAEKFNTVDSFDTHARMRDYVTALDKVATEHDHLSFVGIGWDPGVFSVMRALFEGVLPEGNTVTFWGKGVSQGHSEAIRKIDGVLKGIQYTIPKEDALEKAREGKGDTLTTRDKHLRECFVVARDDADKSAIENEIKSMPNYFADYDTVVHFITAEEFDRDHNAMPHGGLVLRSGSVNGKEENLEFKLTLSSNPDFTASVLMAYARSLKKMHESGVRGAKTIIDIPVGALLGDRLDAIAKFV